MEGTIDFDGVQIIRTKGQHGSEETLEVLGQVSAFVLKKDNYPTIYMIGDYIWNEVIEQPISFLTGITLV